MSSQRAYRAQFAASCRRSWVPSCLLVPSADSPFTGGVTLAASSVPRLARTADRVLAIVLRMALRLLVVEDAFVTRGRGVLVNPKVTADPAARAPFKVRLRFSNGEERETLAVYEFSHVRGPLLPFALVRL